MVDFDFNSTAGRNAGITINKITVTDSGNFAGNLPEFIVFKINSIGDRLTILSGLIGTFLGFTQA